MWKKTAGEKIAAREKETKKEQYKANRKKEKEEKIKKQLKEQLEKETEKAQKKEIEKAWKKAQKHQSKGTAPTVPENTQQTGHNGGKPTEDSGRHAQRHVHKGADTPELPTPSQPQPGGSHHDGSMTERGYTPASTTDPAEDRNRPAQNNLQKGDGNPKLTTASQPQPEGSQHDWSMTGSGNTPASTTDDTSRLQEENVRNGVGNPEHTTPSQPQPECSQHDVAMTERGKTPCGATDDTLSCAPKELTDANATADNEEDMGITQRTAADGGNHPLQSNLAEDEVKEAEKDQYLKELQEENEKIKKEMELDNSPSDNTTLEVRCMVVVDGDGIRQTRSAREQFLNNVKTSLSSDGINLDTTNMAPDDEMDEDKAGQLTKPLLLIVPCLATSHVENTISNAIHKITIRREHKKLLVVFHRERHMLSTCQRAVIRSVQRSSENVKSSSM